MSDDLTAWETDPDRARAYHERVMREAIATVRKADEQRRGKR